MKKDTIPQGTPSQKEPVPSGSSITDLAIGLSLGVLVGVIIDNIGLGMMLGVAVGLCVGPAVGALRKSKKPEEPKDDHETQ